jgi:hypothetical protein
MDSILQKLKVEGWHLKPDVSTNEHAHAPSDPPQQQHG